MSFLQKITIHLVIILSVWGIVTVDTAYSEMMNEEPALSVTVRRVDEEHVVVSALGLSGRMNTKNLQEGWVEFCRWADSLMESVKERISS